MHLRGELAGPSVPRAIELLERSAAAGFVTAAFALGQLYDSGRADVATGRPDPAAALRWYRQAAEAGSVDGQVEVATAYYLGRGVAADPAQALAWYRRAATGGDVGAQYLVASMYETGLGVRPDLRLARYWYATAAAQGDSAAALKARALDEAGSAPAAPAVPSDAASR
jgi:TPR repeat protein